MGWHSECRFIYLQWQSLRELHKGYKSHPPAEVHGTAAWLLNILILLVYTLVLKVHYLMYMGIVPCSGFLIHPPIMIPHDYGRKLPDITTTNHYYHSNLTVIENSHKDTKSSFHCKERGANRTQPSNLLISNW